MNKRTKALEKAKGGKTTRAAAFEKDMNRQEKQMLKERARRVKSGGFKSERDYFTNVDPFTGKRRGT